LSISTLVVLSYSSALNALIYTNLFPVVIGSWCTLVTCPQGSVARASIVNTLLYPLPTIIRGIWMN